MDEPKSEWGSLEKSEKGLLVENVDARQSAPGGRRLDRSRPSSYKAKFLLLVLVPLLLALSDVFDTTPARQLRSLQESWLAGSVSGRSTCVSTPRATDCRHSIRPHLIAEQEQSEVAEAGKANGTVEWDKYSLIINGERVFLWGGEFHTWRLPVVELWRDILEKFKAAGLNSVSIYVHWGLVNPAPGVFDFDGFRALEPLFEMARDIGLWVVVRPGPYINAETNAGGIPGWVTTLPARIRTNDTAFTEAWRPFIARVAEMTAPWQVTRTPGGVGPVIAVQVDNEYTDDGGIRTEYMRLVAEELRKGGIDVPLTFNDAERFGNFVKGPAKVDIYGFDSYPEGFDCSNPDFWWPLREGYRTYHEATNPDQPLYIPEFQGGAFDPWGGPGYEKCRELTGREFESVFNLHMFAENVKMANLYMVYGGTNWGSLAFPGVYTSYDYGSAIAENRALTPKYQELKSQGLFLSGSPAFAKTDFIGNSSTNNYTDNKEVFATELTNPDTGATWLIVRHQDSTSKSKLKYKLLGKFSGAEPHLHIRGRESKILSFNTTFGSSTNLVSSSASVFWTGRIGGRDAVVLRSHPEDEVVADFRSSSVVCMSLQSTAARDVQVSCSSGDDRAIRISAPAAASLGNFGARALANEVFLVVIASASDTDRMWAVHLRRHAGSVVAKTNEPSIIVEGADLVREAYLDRDGSRLSLRGDIKADSDGPNERRITVFCPSSVSLVRWNGKSVQTVALVPGYLQFTVTRPVHTVDVPNLRVWHYQNSLPEIQDGFDDSTFVPAVGKKTNNPHKPRKGKYVLYGCDYGFCEGTVVWRGRFEGGLVHGINLTFAGGAASAASAWLNGAFVGSTNAIEALKQSEVHASFSFPYGSVRDDFNTLTIVQDNSGMEETNEGDPETIKQPRGIRSYQILGNATLTWSVTGRSGGYSDYVDRTRGVFNEGGLFGERAGWHLPGVDDLGWGYREIEEGLPHSEPGVGFFRTTFDLNVEDEFDVMFSINVAPGKGSYRAFIFVNGWQMGKFVSVYGPQHKFPVPRGILKHQGTNTLAIALWTLEDDAAPGGVFLALDDVYYKG